MTNKEDEGDAGSRVRLAGLLAVHLVSQVLDEANFIANAAMESGQPWRYISLLKDLRRGYQMDAEDVTFGEAKVDDDDAVDKKGDAVANIVATSTPQKAAIDETKIVRNETGFIGQGAGDEAEMMQNALTDSTSVFINHLFDMSEVERDIYDSELVENDSNDVITEDVTEIMESYVNNALGIAFGQELSVIETHVGEVSSSSENSGYSYLTDALNMVEVGKEDAFCLGSEATCSRNIGTAVKMIEQDIRTKEETVKKDDVTFYENAYLTLNRDYDQCSDEDGDSILQDTKSMPLKEVELIARNASNENSPVLPRIGTEKEISQVKIKELQSKSCRKSNLVQRCRIQGSRLVSRLRGWWRRNTPGKRKESRMPGSARGLCPLSPDARRRAASLLDQRKLTSVSEHEVWKFNTVSEAFVNSSRWRNYTFNVTQDKCGEN